MSIPIPGQTAPIPAPTTGTASQTSQQFMFTQHNNNTADNRHNNTTGGGSGGHSGASGGHMNNNHHYSNNANNHPRSLLFGKVDQNKPIYNRQQMLQVLKDMCIGFDEVRLKEQHTLPVQGAPPHQIVIQLKTPQPTSEELLQQQQKQQLTNSSQITCSTTINNYNAILQQQALAPWSLALDWRRQHNLEKTKKIREQQTTTTTPATSSSQNNSTQQQQGQQSNLPIPTASSSSSSSSSLPLPTQPTQKQILPTPGSIPIPSSSQQQQHQQSLPLSGISSTISSPNQSQNQSQNGLLNLPLPSPVTGLGGVLPVPISSSTSHGLGHLPTPTPTQGTFDPNIHMNVTGTHQQLSPMGPMGPINPALIHQQHHQHGVGGVGGIRQNHPNQPFFDPNLQQQQQLSAGSSGGFDPHHHHHHLQQQQVGVSGIGGPHHQQHHPHHPGSGVAPGFFPPGPHMPLGIPPMMHSLFFFNLLSNFQDPAQTIWYYTDQYRCEQGPFSSNDMRQWYYQGYITDSLQIRFAGQPQPNSPQIDTPPFPLAHWFMNGRSAFLQQIPEQYMAQAQHAIAMQKQMENFQIQHQQQHQQQLPHGSSHNQTNQNTTQQQQQLHDSSSSTTSQQQQQPQHGLFFGQPSQNGQFPTHFNPMGMFQHQQQLQQQQQGSSSGAVTGGSNLNQTLPTPQPTTFLQAVGGVPQGGMPQNMPFGAAGIGMGQYQSHQQQHHQGGVSDPYRYNLHANDQIDDDDDNNDDDDGNGEGILDEEYQDPFNDTLGYIPDDDYSGGNGNGIGGSNGTGGGAELAYTASFHRANQHFDSFDGQNNQQSSSSSTTSSSISHTPQSDLDDIDTPLTSTQIEAGIRDVYNNSSENLHGSASGSTPAVVAAAAVPQKNAWGIIPQATVKSFNEIQKEQASEQERLRKQQLSSQKPGENDGIPMTAAAIVAASGSNGINTQDKTTNTTSKAYVERLQPIDYSTQNFNDNLYEKNEKISEKTSYVERLQPIEDKYDLDNKYTSTSSSSSSSSSSSLVAPKSTAQQKFETKSGWSVLVQPTPSLPTGSEKLTTISATISQPTGWAKAAALTPAPNATVTIPIVPGPVTMLKSTTNNTQTSSSSSSFSTTVLSGATFSSKASQALKSGSGSTSTTNAWGKPVSIPPTTPAKGGANTGGNKSDSLDVFQTPQKLPQSSSSAAAGGTFSTPAPVRDQASSSSTSIATTAVEKVNNTQNSTTTTATTAATNGPKPMSAAFKKWFSGELKKLVGSADVASFEWIWDLQDVALCKETLLDAFGDRTFANDFVRYRDVDQKQTNLNIENSIGKTTSTTSSSLTGIPTQDTSSKKKQQAWTTVDDGKHFSTPKVNQTTTTTKKNNGTSAAVQNNAFAALTTTKLSNQQLTQSKKRK